MDTSLTGELPVVRQGEATGGFCKFELSSCPPCSRALLNKRVRGDTSSDIALCLSQSRVIWSRSLDYELWGLVEQM